MKVSSVFWNINNFLVVSVSGNVRKAFFEENVRNFLGISVADIFWEH